MKYTALDAKKLGYDVCVIRDCCSGVNMPGTMDSAEKEMAALLGDARPKASPTSRLRFSSRCFFPRAPARLTVKVFAASLHRYFRSTSLSTIVVVLLILQASGGRNTRSGHHRTNERV